MGFLGAVGSYMIGGPDAMGAYYMNQASGRGGFGTTFGDVFWRGVTGTPAMDSAFAGGRFNASMWNMMGMSPTMLGMSSMMAGPMMYGGMPYNPMMLGAGAWY